MRGLILFCISLLSFSAFNAKAGIYEYFPGTYSIVSTTVDPGLPATEAEFVFTYVDGTGKNITANAMLGYKNEKKKIEFDRQGKFHLKVKPGKHRFTFNATDYSTIITDSILIQPSNRIVIKVQLEKEAINVICRKPVIYLYPEETTAINITLNFKGEMLFTYPECDENNSWNVIADPDGTITMHDKEYNYLFWEGNSDIIAAEAKLNEGFIVEKENLLLFLEQSLAKIGLNTKEQADFITYWYPLMLKNEMNFVRFIFNDTYDQYAHLNVSPVPVSNIRLFMLWTNGNGIQPVKKQELPSFRREGFTLVEWGGAEVEHPELTFKNN